jgi:hypothetical protein
MLSGHERSVGNESGHVLSPAASLFFKIFQVAGIERDFCLGVLDGHFAPVHVCVMHDACKCI